MVESSPITTWFCTGWKVIQLSMEPPGIGFMYWKSKRSWFTAPRRSAGMVTSDLPSSSPCSTGRRRISLFTSWELLRLNDCRNWSLRLISIRELSFTGGMV